MNNQELHPIEERLASLFPNPILQAWARYAGRVDLLLSLLKELKKYNLWGDKISWVDIYNILKRQRGFQANMNESIQNIPNNRAGPLVITANHPYPILDWLALQRQLEKVRHCSDVKFVANSLISSIPEMQNIAIQSPDKTRKDRERFRNEIAELLEWKWVLIGFPRGVVDEGKWKDGLIKIAKRHDAEIIPTYVWAPKTWFLYRWLRQIAPDLAANFNPQQALRKWIDITINYGSAISPQNLTADQLKKIVYSLSK